MTKEMWKIVNKTIKSKYHWNLISFIKQLKINFIVAGMYEDDIVIKFIKVFENEVKEKDKKLRIGRRELYDICLKLVPGN